MNSDGVIDLADARQLVDSVEVRVVSRAQRPLWDRLMSRHHYLGFNSMVGESLRYVAVYKEHWVALLGWAAPALSCKVRDQWIGWSSDLKHQRLALLANNSRFLILPGVRAPNLASRILALNVKRLSQDWQVAYHHPIWIVETFVDPCFFQGTCYKAAGWLCLGNTRGFARHSGHYTHHGHVKLVFVRPVRRNASQRLSDPYLRIQLKRKPRPMKLSAKKAELLLEALRTIPDSRMPRGKRHKKISILAISICAIICGARSFAAIAQWGQECSQNMLKRLMCRYNKKTRLYEPPSEPTIRRFLQTIDAQAVDGAITAWSLYSMSWDSPVAVDGKTLKGARDHNGRQVHLLAAFLHESATVVAQQQVPGKTNEITVLPPLLEPLPLEGRVVTTDALHTQRDSARTIVEEKKGHYLSTVKDNQSNLKKDIEDLNLVAFPPSTPECR